MLKLITPLLLCFFLFTSQAFAQVVISENFDTGIPATWTVVDLGAATGDSWAGTVGGAAGSYLDGTEFAFVDSDANGNGVAMLEEIVSPTFDGTPYTSKSLFVSFDHFFRALVPSVGYVLINNAASWDTLETFTVTDGAFGAPVNKLYDITPYISTNMQIRFVYDDGDTWAWYWAVDNFSVYSPVANDVGVSAISDISNGRLGTLSALSAAETVTVEVSNFSGAPVGTIPVNLALNGAVVATETLAGPVPANGTMMYTFTQTVDLTAAGNYAIESFTSLPADAVTINDSSAVSVSQLDNPVVSLPYNESFEGMAGFMVRNSFIGLLGATQWDFETDVPGEGRLRSEAGMGYANTGTQAITMDIDPSGNIAINYATATLNMSAYDATVGNPITLSFNYMEHGDEVSPNDLVWVRGSETDPWVVVLDWNVGTGAVNGVYFAEIEFPLGATLLANNQNFSSTTQIRFGQEDNFPSTTTTGSDGFSFDDVSIEQQLTDDLAVIDVINGSTCGISSAYVDVMVTNKGGQAQTNVPVGVEMSGAFTAIATATLASIASGDTMMVTVGPLNTAPGGTVTITGFSGLSNDQYLPNDTLAIMGTFTAEVTPVSVASGACPGSAAYAVATAVTGGSNQWFDANGTMLGTGDSLPLGILTADTTVYLSTNSVALGNLGIQDSIGGGQYTVFTDGLVFDIINEITLDSVFIYGVGAGDVTMNLLDAAGTIINTTTAPLLAQNVKSVFPVGFTIPPGVGYQLNAVGSTVTSLNRETVGAVYPYSTNDMSITGPINGLAGFYYFFYDWHYSSGCESGQVSVTVSLLQTSVTLQGNVSCNGGADGAAMATAAGGLAPYSYAWSNGEATATAIMLPAGVNDVSITDADGCVSVESITVTEPTLLTATTVATGEIVGADGTVTLTAGGGTAPYTYSWSNGATTQNIMGLVAGTYCVTVTDDNGCIATSCDMVSPLSSVETIDGVQSIKLFPNPTQGRTSLQVIFDNPLNIQMEVSNVLGQTLIQESYYGVTRINQEIDLGNNPSGNYFLTLRSGDNMLTKRLVLSK